MTTIPQQGDLEMKMNKIVLSLLALAVAIASFGTASIAFAQAPVPGAGSSQSGTLANLPSASDLTAEEEAALLYLREEEKLAHDVYVTLYDLWGLPVFENISQSEQTHTDAVATLIDRYDLTDPALSEVGVFTNPELQALYDELVALGSQSLADALTVGATIEEVDIQDLEERLAVIDNADILQVFNNLEKGSTNHLRAFVSTLETQTGEIYQPQYLSLDEYQAILAGKAGNGNGRGGQGGMRSGAGQGAGVTGGQGNGMRGSAGQGSSTTTGQGGGMRGSWR
jgi:hypothetical protein